MRYIHAIIFFFQETLRIRKVNKIPWTKYLREFLGMLWTFLKLEWNDARRGYGYAPITKYYNTNPMKGGRKRKPRKNNKRK